MLRAVSVIVLLVFASVVPGHAQEPSAAVVSSVTALENRWAAALQKLDTAAIDMIFAATYVDTDEEGHRTDKSGVLAMLKSGDLKITSLTLSNMHVNAYGDAVVVTGSAVQIGSFKGQPLTRNVVFTDTFVLQGGKWVAVASQRTPMR